MIPSNGFKFELLELKLLFTYLDTCTERKWTCQIRISQEVLHFRVGVLGPRFPLIFVPLLWDQGSQFIEKCITTIEKKIIPLGSPM